jgi:PKD repeat protein
VRDNYITNHKYTKIGEHKPVVTVHYSALDINIPSEEKAENRVIVYEPLKPTAECIPNPAMIGEAVTCYGQSTGVPVSWYWEFFDGFNSTLQNPTHTYFTPGDIDGIYPIELTVTDIAGNKISAIFELKVINATTPDLVTLTWDPLQVPMVSSSSRDVAFVLDRPNKGLYAVEFTATIGNTGVAAFTGKGTNSSSWREFRVEPVGDPFFSSTGDRLYKSVNVYGVSYVGFPSSNSKLELGKLEIFGIADGTAQMTFSSPQIAYGKNSNELYRVNLTSATITVKTQSYTTLPLPGMKGPQQDLDKNGLIDDFDGNGEVNANDVIVFFEAYVKGYLSPASSYDYNKDGRLNLQDIVVFFDKWSALNKLSMTF